MKSTKIEVEERVYTVARLLLQGITRTSDIIHYASEKTDWGVTGRQIETYVKEARDLIKIDNQKELSFERALAIGQLDDLIRRNLLAGDLKEVRGCIKAKAEILGMIVSRFADREIKEPALVIKSRFADRWAQASGDK